MALKTVSKKLSKTLPIGEDIANAIAIDDKTIDAEIVPSAIENKATDMNNVK